MTKLNLISLSVICTAIGSAGCGRPTSIAGRVTMDGKPLDRAIVLLTPPDKGAELVLGTTGSDGRFLIKPAVGRTIAPGTYKVTVSRRELLTPAQEAAYLPAKELIPAKYSALPETVLSLEVPPASDIEFVLTSK